MDWITCANLDRNWLIRFQNIVFVSFVTDSKDDSGQSRPAEVREIISYDDCLCEQCTRCRSNAAEAAGAASVSDDAVRR